jgi:hypothetical protein
VIQQKRLYCTLERLIFSDFYINTTLNFAKYFFLFSIFPFPVLFSYYLLTSLQYFARQAIENWFWFSLHRGCKKLFLFLNFADTRLLYHPNHRGELPLHISLRRGHTKLSCLIIQMMTHGKTSES